MAKCKSPPMKLSTTFYVRFASRFVPYIEWVVYLLLLFILTKITVFHFWWDHVRETPVGSCIFVAWDEVNMFTTLCFRFWSTTGSLFLEEFFDKFCTFCWTFFLLIKTPSISLVGDYYRRFIGPICRWVWSCIVWFSSSRNCRKIFFLYKKKSHQIILFVQSYSYEFFVCTKIFVQHYIFLWNFFVCAKLFV